VQESLHNIIKHAGASSILVTVKNADGTMELCISDNGKGFDPASVEEMKGAGMGLRNMPNRARLINAGFSLESKPGKGTEIRLTLPMNQ
jgi:signal transduction histidine kinase